MRYITKNTIIEEFQKLLNSSKTGSFQLKGNGVTVSFTLTLEETPGSWFKKKVYFAHVIDNKNRVIYTSKKYGSYNSLINEDIYPYLIKNKLIIIGNNVTILNEISPVCQEEQSNFFNFDSFLLQQSTKSGVPRFKWKDVAQKTAFIKKVRIENNTIMNIYFQNGTIIKREYRRDSLLEVLIQYLEELVEAKKKNQIKEINNIISLFYSTQKQNLNIIESDTESLNEINTGYIDTNLVNSFLVLCSLSDLTIDRNKVKMWLAKNILSKEPVNVIYFT